jgi:hypothetical protein
MLDRTTSFYPLSTALSTASPTLIGRRTYGHMSKSQKAALAVEVLQGRATLRPTIRTVGAAIGVSPAYIEAAAKLSPRELHQLRAGYRTLQELRTPDAHERFLKAARELGTDAALDILAAAEAA